MICYEKAAKRRLSEIVSRLANEGTICVVTGPPGAGKTATTLDVARAWGARTGGHLVGNTSWDGFDDVVRSDVQMLESMASVKGPSLGVIDETMQELTGRGAEAKAAEKFADRVSFLRKKEGEHGPHAKRGSLLLVSHIWSRMNKPTREMATLIIQKPSRNDPGKAVLWESDGGEDSREKIAEFKGLTDTRESYDEHEASAFGVVLDEGDDGEDELDEDTVRRDEAISTVLRAVRPWSDSDGMTYREAGKLVDYSSAWVSSIVAEWRDGEYRDLVNEPEDTTA